MKKRSWMTLPLLALVALGSWTTPRPVAAADAKPVAVVSFAGYDALKSDLDFIGELGESPQLGQMFEGIIALFTRAQGLVGLKKDAPIGAAILLGENAPPGGFVFVPVSDSEKLLDALQGLIPSVEDAGDGFKKLQLQKGPPILMKEKDGWAFLGMSPDHLSDLPADPAKLLGDLPKKYDLAVRVNVGNVPEPLVEVAVDQMRRGAGQALERKLPNETDEAFEARKELAGEILEQTVHQIKQLDHFTIGLSIDAKKHGAFADVEVMMKDGSDIANELNAASSSRQRSDLAGFADEEQVAHLFTFAPILSDDRRMLRTLVDQARKGFDSKIGTEDLPIDDPEAKEILKKSASDVFDVLEATIDEGLVEGGVVLVGEGPFSLVGGFHVHDGKKLGAALKKALQIAAKSPDAPEIEFDADEHAGVTFHTITPPVDDEAAEFFGEEAIIAVGFGEKSVIFALGEDPIEEAKAVLDASKQGPTGKLPPTRFAIAIAPLLYFAADMEENEKQQALMEQAAELMEKDGKDHVRLTGEYVKNGQRVRLEIEDGILRAIGKLAMQAAAGGN